MQLNPEGRARFQQHLQSFLRQPCSICGMGSWQVEDSIFELREFLGGALVPPQGQVQVKPVMAMTCNNCGHTVLMNPIKTGIININQQAAPQQIPQPSAEETVIEEEVEE